MTTLVLGVVLALSILPFAIYFGVKLGTVAFFTGRQYFNESTKTRREKRDDEE